MRKFLLHTEQFKKNIIIHKTLLTIIAKVVNQDNFMDEVFRTTV